MSSTDLQTFYDHYDETFCSDWTSLPNHVFLCFRFVFLARKFPQKVFSKYLHFCWNTFLMIQNFREKSQCKKFKSLKTYLIKNVNTFTHGNQNTAINGSFHALIIRSDCCFGRYYTNVQCIYLQFHFLLMINTCKFVHYQITVVWLNKCLRFIQSWYSNWVVATLLTNLYIFYF